MVQRKAEVIQSILCLDHKLRFWNEDRYEILLKWLHCTSCVRHDKKLSLWLSRGVAPGYPGALPLAILISPRWG
ncbi:MAG: hypothetical protein DRR08_01570 [Candidatus Parabeggiatoa sp. nov. 2]|nr:MAG: hypothetical protein B6247_03300 [Beggiatoa sp. 4572_84]RKZ64136.1 MAG: hypothetical protein DRR08_01570 [Gammaproteobacteria bacterium]